MGRKKNPRPHHASGIVGTHEKAEAESKFPRNQKPCSTSTSDHIDSPFYVEVDRTHRFFEERLDVCELILSDLNVREGFSDFLVGEGFYLNFNYGLRFRLDNVGKNEFRIRLGHWPILPASSTCLELIQKQDSEDAAMHRVVLSGSFDGPDEGVSGLVHLSSLRFITLRPIIGDRLLEDVSSIRVRVQMLRSIFEASRSLLDSSRQAWKRSMISFMAWVRPEVTTSEARYGVCKPIDVKCNLKIGTSKGSSNASPCPGFDAAGFYEAIKPSKEEPILESDIPQLLPELRKYQRRAAYWMVQREKGPSYVLSEQEQTQTMSPLCMTVDLLDTCTKMFYNPFSGSVSLYPEYSFPHIFGGILADEMGLGKTVELLACIFAHQKSDNDFVDTVVQINEDQYNNLRRLKKERIECVCGSVTESLKYEGLWVQCDICDAWQHADCVGYSAAQKTIACRKVRRACKSSARAGNKSIDGIIEDEGEYICQLCSELIQASHSPVASGATLIVCPAPILEQWHAEITRHTKRGSLNICIYEGVKDTSLSAASGTDIGELVAADIVLTTYDVLREDLSHDSDRHEGDRRFMRFQKRYPVTPTPLTRIFWWRICLDEAQMVESNAAAATEMALRLHTRHRWCVTGTPIQRRFEDLYGLLKFLQATPFDVSRWWIEVIRDPYESRDVTAMEFTHKFFKRIMWRSLKIHVVDELLLPPQEESLSWLIFSPIEEYFYRKQHETCVIDAREVIECFKGSLQSDASLDHLITQEEASKLLTSLLKLRQACCHPQVGSSGLCSLQQSPMPMENILEVFVRKTKIEGEEALRKLVVALNGLAGIAIISQDFSEAVSLYKEALALCKEHSKDFSLDLLLNIHIHHNLAEVLPVTSKIPQHLSEGAQFSDESTQEVSKKRKVEGGEQFSMKRQKYSNDIEAEKLSASASDVPENGSVDDNKCYDDKHNLSETPDVRLLRTACQDMKIKYLSSFSSKLSLAQREFRKSYKEVSNASRVGKDYHVNWWLEALDHVGESGDSSSKFLRKIEGAVTGTMKRFGSVNALKYHIQTALDLLDTSRKSLVDRLLEIDQTMENPREEDIERVRYCSDCCSGDGPKCEHCELDELFQVYEARLFRTDKHGELMDSAEDVVNFQKRKSALNHFLWTLSEPNGLSANIGDEKNRRRGIGGGIVVSKSPSELEVVLGVLKSYCKNHLRSAAAKHLHLLESLRKEYALARSLAAAQAQLLRAHDEIRQSTSRLHLKEHENDKSCAALCSEELIASSVEYSHEKLNALDSLLRIRGQLRYLEGLKSKQKLQLDSPSDSSLTQNPAPLPNSPAEEEESIVKAYEEACPICQEKLNSQKMVFQCGHVTCCRFVTGDNGKES